MNTSGMQKPRSRRLAELNADGFFESGLEYNTPARGMWNIVHTGMLIPGAHQIFACAEGCLRGVILTAAEMLALDRLSWISVSEEDMFDGTLESDIIDGVCEIIERLPEPGGFVADHQAAPVPAMVLEDLPGALLRAVGVVPHAAAPLGAEHEREVLPEGIGIVEGQLALRISDFLGGEAAAEQQQAEK